MIAKRFECCFGSEVETMTERRDTPRHRTILVGRVVFDEQRAAVNCDVRDMSATGARLRFGALLQIPDAFTLEIPAKRQSFQAEAKWRRGLEIGVAFAP